MLDKIFRDKKAGEKLLSAWWFVIIIIVGGGVAVSVIMYYSADVDIKEVEAEILYEKIVECTIQQGVLIEEIFEKDFDIFKKCGLSKKVFESKDFSFKISVLDDSEKLIREEIIKGDISFEKDCEIKEKIKAESYLKCVKRTENILYHGDGIKKGVLEVLTASNQIGRKIPILE